MEIATLQVGASNVLDMTDDPNFLSPARELLDSARRQLAHIVTDRLTPWLEPYHVPEAEDHS